MGGLKRSLRWDEKKQRYFFHYDPKFTRQTEIRKMDDQSDLAFTETLWLLAAKNIHESRIPTLLVKGRFSDIVSDTGVEGLMTSIPSAKLVDVHGRHMVAGDDNAVFNAAILEF